jgi:VWFA-related protein
MMRRILPTVTVFSLVAAAAVLSQAPPLPQNPPQQQKPPAQQPPPPAGQPQPDLVVTTDLVRMVFTVMTRRQRLITHLEKGDFKVTENGQQQEIAFFGKEVDLPLRVGVIMDTSNSIRSRLRFEQEAATDFVHNVIRRRKDLAFLMTFDSDTGIVQDYTDDAGSLSAAIQRQRAGGGTALYDAVYFACAERLMNPPLPKAGAPETRKVLVLISDGDDTHSNRARSEAIEICQRAEASIYAISTSTDWLAVSGNKPEKTHKSDGDKVLEQMAEETGGRAFFPYKTDDLAASFQDIGVELRSQYSLAYEPRNKLNDGKFRHVKIEVPALDVRVRSRKGYYPNFGKSASAAPTRP